MRSQYVYACHSRHSSDGIIDETLDHRASVLDGHSATIDAPPIADRAASAARVASLRRGNLSEDSMMITALCCTRRHNQRPSSSFKTSNFHMSDRIGQRVPPREIGQWHGTCNRFADMRNQGAERVRRVFVKFEIYIDNDAAGVYRWRLLASDGQVMATSRESYPHREAVRRAIIALQASIPVARIVDGLVVHRSSS